MRLIMASMPAIVCLSMLAACAGKPDMSYRDSVDGPPLVIPAGLDTPARSPAMEIPAARAAVPDSAGDDIEKPPSLREGR